MDKNLLELAFALWNLVHEYYSLWEYHETEVDHWTTYNSKEMKRIEEIKKAIDDIVQEHPVLRDLIIDNI